MYEFVNRYNVNQMFINFFYLKRYKNFSFMVLDILSDATDRCFLTKLTNLTKLTIEYSDCYGNKRLKF